MRAASQVRPGRRCCALALAAWLCMALVPAPAVAAGTPPPRANACEPPARACQEWIVLAQPGTDMQAAAQWLAGQGIRQSRSIPADLRQFYIWLPKGAQGEALQRAIGAQAWVQLLTDQVRHAPSAR